MQPARVDRMAPHHCARVAAGSRLGSRRAFLSAGPVEGAQRAEGGNIYIGFAMVASGFEAPSFLLEIHSNKLTSRQECMRHHSCTWQQDGFLKSTHTLRAQKFLPKRIISRNTAPPVPFLAPIRSATAGRALTRRPFVDRVGNRRVTDDFAFSAVYSQSVACAACQRTAHALGSQLGQQSSLHLSSHRSASVCSHCRQEIPQHPLLSNSILQTPPPRLRTATSRQVAVRGGVT